MLEQDEPRFANWDQDETAVRERYWEQDAITVAADLAAAGDDSAALFDVVPDDGWERRGFRSNGSEFTVAGIGRYYLTTWSTTCTMSTDEVAGRMSGCGGGGGYQRVRQNG